MFCCGRHIPVIIPAVAGSTSSCLHLSAEQSTQNGGKLRAHREGQGRTHTRVLHVFQSCHFLKLLSSLSDPTPIKAAEGSLLQKFDLHCVGFMDRCKMSQQIKLSGSVAQGSESNSWAKHIALLLLCFIIIVKSLLVLTTQHFHYSWTSRQTCRTPTILHCACAYISQLKYPFKPTLGSCV